jgi:plasmid stability protein
MSNVTISIDDDLLRRARIRALENGTSVNALLRRYLQAYVGVDDERVRAIEGVIELSKRAKAGSDGATWSREELHD